MKLINLFEELKNEKSKYHKLPFVLWQHLKLRNGFERTLETLEQEGVYLTPHEIAELAHNKIDWVLKSNVSPNLEGEFASDKLHTNVVSFYPIDSAVMDAGNYIRVHVYYEEK